MNPNQEFKLLKTHKDLGQLD